MNTVSLTGRLTRDPDVRYTQGAEQKATARFTLAVERRIKTENGPQADFISCVAWGKTAEFIEKYFTKGQKMEVRGRIQTGSYTSREGQKVYTTDVVCEEVAFAESKKAQGQQQTASPAAEPEAGEEGFMHIPEGLDDELPFR